MMKVGIGKQANDTALDIREFTFSELAEKMRTPKIGPKNGLYLVRGGEMSEPRRSDETLKIGELLVVDGDSSFDVQTGEILPGAPDFNITAAAFRNLKTPFILHTTHSNEPGKPKWRAYVPAYMTSSSQLLPCVTMLVEQLNALGCAVVQTRECSAWSQAWFTPRVPSEEALAWFQFDAVTDGTPFDVQAAVAAAKAQEDVAKAVERVQAAPKPTPNANGPSPIESFNASATIETVRYMLEQAGYRLCYRRGDTLRMIAPGSETGTAGVHVFKGRQRGDIVAYSHHGGHDPLSGRLNDAFGVLTRVRHKGDQDAAIAEAKAVVGWASRRDPTEGFEVIAEDFNNAPRPGTGLGASTESWESNLLVNGRGNIVTNAENLRLYMTHHEAWQGILAYDEFVERVILLQPLPGMETRNFRPRELEDRDAFYAVAWFNRNGFPTLTSEFMVDSAMKAQAHANTIHPIRHYLDGLKWDGKGRLDTWLEDYCAAVPSLAERQYTRDVGVKFFLGAVARIYKPGVKVDSALILEGEQGVGKSTAMRVLCGDAFFGDNLPSMSSKDASSYIRGKWIVELGELAAMQRNEVEIVKAFISRTEERFRPAYGRNEVRYPRQCVFVGTTNRSDFLRDETGNRRFWPVCVGKIDLGRLEADRDQLWAEAVQRANKGETWWLEGDVIKTASEVQENRVQEDAWRGIVVHYLAGKSHTSIVDIAEDALKMDAKQIDTSVRNRIVGLLTVLKWKKDGRYMTRDRNRGSTRFVPPAARAGETDFEPEVEF